MRKLKLQIQISLDGFVAGPNGEGDFIWIAGPDAASVQKVFETADSSDTILLGRKMTPDFVKHWEDMVDNKADGPWLPLAKLMVNHRKVVFSRTETAIKGRNLEIENGDLVTAVNALKQQPGKDILVYGGADFVSSLIRENLIDEYHLILNPVALGRGLSIFKEKKVLKLESSITFKNGKVWNKYLPV